MRVFYRFLYSFIKYLHLQILKLKTRVLQRFSLLSRRPRTNTKSSGDIRHRSQLGVPFVGKTRAHKRRSCPSIQNRSMAEGRRRRAMDGTWRFGLEQLRRLQFKTWGGVSVQSDTQESVRMGRIRPERKRGHREAPADPRIRADPPWAAEGVER